ncbi:hypothetical protein FN846DRAFT_780324 [Sphaerosporella brunnea]|uniref:Uncharacterized protein n=1 Tax=Sphaerosporella brunnea TaxID=1250544 RepID=A0A5J5EUU7_9PEZI|nr:hypothetical protein FN846DRAFT_780324 [Sphaerosporella brunnea]
MQFLSVRCLACQNLDSFPRMSYEDIPYCSQCASTSDLVPETPPAATKAPAATTPDDLIALFNQQLYLSSSQQQQLATPPTSPIPATAKFSISQHYNHSMHHTPQQQQRQQQQQAPSPPSSAKSADREYAEYLLASDLSSPNSLNELEIALAHGIVSGEEYARAVAGYTLATQREQAQRYQMQHQRKALEEDCSAMDMLRAAKSRDDMSAWCNDYYGGVDSGFVDDEEAPCSVYAGNAGCRLRPFDL